MSAKQNRWTPALSTVQIYNKEHLLLFEQWWKELGQLGNIKTYIQDQVLADAAKDCQLFASVSDSEKASLFFPVKEKLNCAIDLLQSFHEVGKNAHSPLLDEPATQQLLQECLDLIKTFYAQVNAALPQIEPKFTFSLSEAEIKSLVQQLYEKHQRTRIGSSLIPQDQIDQSCFNLQTSLNYIQQNFSAIRRTIFSIGRNLFFFASPECPNPFVITTSGKIYLILFDPLNNIGKGSVKRVFRCIDLASKQWVAAIKARTHFPDEDPATQVIFCKKTFFRLLFEGTIMKKLRGHEGIIQVYDMIPFKTSTFPEIFLFEELFEFQDLRQFLRIAIHMREIACSFSTAQQNQIALQLLKVLATIHSFQILHRSIKAANFLLQFDWDPQRLRIALTDFEDGCFLYQLERRKTIRWLSYNDSPEYAKMKLNNEQTDEEIIQCNNTPYDVWDMGLILYQLFLLKYPPWFTIPEEDRTSFIAMLEPSWAKKDVGDHPMAPLILALLNTDPQKRLTAEQALRLLERMLSASSTGNGPDGMV